MNGHGENFLGPFLSNDVLIQVGFDFHRLVELRGNIFFGFFPIFSDDVITEVDAFIADVDGGSGNQSADFVAALSTERATEMSINLIPLCHASSPVLLVLGRVFSSVATDCLEELRWPCDDFVDETVPF